MKEIKNMQSKDNDSIDLIKIVKEFWVFRKIIFKITLLFVFLGLFISFFSKNEFTASTTFVPVNQGKSVSGSLGGLASLAGINLGNSANSEEISPKLYPQIVQSIPFQMELLKTSLTIEGLNKTVTYKEFYKSIYSPGLLANLKTYTFGLPSIIMSLFKSEGSNVTLTKKKNDLIDISAEDNALIKQLQNQISIDVNDKEGFVSISVSFSESMASAELTLKTQELLQEYVLKFKTQKSNEQFNYIKERFLEKKKEFNDLTIKLARYKDQNNSVNTALGKTELMQIQSDFDLCFTVYSELAKQLEMQGIQVKKDTPLFTVLKPVTIPKDKSAPKRVVIVFIYLIVGFILGLAFVLFKKSLIFLKKEWRLRKIEI